MLQTFPIVYVSNGRCGNADRNINEFTLTKVYVMVCGTLTQRGYSPVPSTWKARIAFTR